MIPLPDRVYLEECFAYDPDSGALIWRHRPREHFLSIRAQRSVNTRFAGRQAGYIDRGHLAVRIDLKLYVAARVIWKIMTGEEPPDLVDHENVNGLDNRWDNLRPATGSDNGCNSPRPRKPGKTLPKGVHRHPCGKFQAGITRYGTFHYLGLFNTPEEAHAAYVEAAHRLHGEFANTGEK